MEELEKLIAEMIAKFNKQVQEDPKLKEQVTGMERHIVIELNDADSPLRFILKDNQISDFGRGTYDEPEIRIMSDIATMSWPPLRMAFSISRPAL